MLLLGWGASAQLVKVDVNLDSIATIIWKKDMQILELEAEIDDYRTIIITKDYTADKLKDTVNSLLWYKQYYMHSKHVLGPRLIGRIEDMIQ